MTEEKRIQANALAAEIKKWESHNTLELPSGDSLWQTEAVINWIDVEKYNACREAYIDKLKADLAEL